MQNRIRSFIEWPHLDNTGTQRQKSRWSLKCLSKSFILQKWTKYTGQHFLHLLLISYNLKKETLTPIYVVANIVCSLKCSPVHLKNGNWVLHVHNGSTINVFIEKHG